MLGVTTAIVQDTRIKRKDGTFAIKLRITCLREQKYYPLSIALSPDDWKKTQTLKPRNESKKLRLYFNKIEQRATDLIKELQHFSFELFEKKFNQSTNRNKDVLSHLEAYKEQLQKEERIGTAEIYKCAFNSFTKFIKASNRKKLKFSDITPDWLLRYEKWMLNNGRSRTSIAIYLRNLRTIMNIGIEEGIISREFYPFGKRKYQIPAGRNIKKALTLAEIHKIVKYQPVTEAECRARDMWIFSYLCNGANIKDIARLQYKNIDQKKITFVRAKTERSTKQNLKTILVVLLPEIKQIIDKWGIKPEKPDTFIFGILDKSDTSEKEHAKVHQATKTINKYMKRIGIKLELDNKITTYTARHSFATVLKRSGAPTEFIGRKPGAQRFENYRELFG